MLKLLCDAILSNLFTQPPSGGCVLKRTGNGKGESRRPAAFGRLCVETQPKTTTFLSLKPAAFGRLCVETFVICTVL